MLMGKLYAMLIYGREGSRGRILAFHWTALLSFAIMFWGMFGVLSIAEAFDKPTFLNNVRMLGIVVSLPLLLFFLCKWGRKQPPV